MISNELNEKLQKIKLLVMDVDGVLTDSGLYYNENGEELKKFSSRDGVGIILLRLNGIKTGFITSGETKIARIRAEKLKVDYITLNHRDKLTAFKEVLKMANIDKEHAAYMGDDIIDTEAMEYAGVSACPADAADHILQISDYVCSKNGGNGAVREFAEIILKANNIEAKYIKNWE